MAESSVDLKLRCAVCLDTFREPASLDCGHTYCKACIESHWRAQSEDRGYTCPLCCKVYYTMPTLSRNIVIADVLEQLAEGDGGGGAESKEDSTGRCPRHGQTLGLYCRTDGRLICVDCTSAHSRHDIAPARDERRAKGSQLIALKETLGGKDVAITAGIADLEQTTRLMEDGAAGTKSRLSGRYAELLDLIAGDRESALAAVDDELASKLMGVRREIERRRAAQLELREALGKIQDLEVTEDPVDFLQRFAQDSERFGALAKAPPEPSPAPRAQFSMAAPLEKRLGELLDVYTGSAKPAPSPPLPSPSPPTPPPPTPIPPLPNIVAGDDGDRPSVPPRVPLKRTDLLPPRGPKGPHVVQPAAGPRVSTNGPSDVTPDCFNRTQLIKKYGKSPSLDQNSAHSELRISGDLKTATLAAKETNVMLRRLLSRDNSARFDEWEQVLCSDAYSSGRHYWEVDVASAGRACRVGVSYASIARKGSGPACRLGMNGISWCLEKHGERIVAWHDGVAATLALAPGRPLPGRSLRRIGVYLDWDAGLVAFHCADTMAPLHAFRCTFAQPLLPAFRLEGQLVQGRFVGGGNLSIVEFKVHLVTGVTPEKTNPDGWQERGPIRRWSTGGVNVEAVIAGTPTACKVAVEISNYSSRTLHAPM
ncbi:unnamed protein product [Lampetra planeri]